MLAHQRPFLVGERPVFLEDRVGDGDLADVVQERAVLQDLELLRP